MSGYHCLISKTEMLIFVKEITKEKYLLITQMHFKIICIVQPLFTECKIFIIYINHTGLALVVCALI